MVQPGVVNIWLTNALKGTGYHYAPDPSSQGALHDRRQRRTNSGGPHTLKYGVTVNHTLGVEAVMTDGSIVQFGGPAEDPVGLDLVGTLVGSEGDAGHCHEDLDASDRPIRRGVRDVVGSVRLGRPPPPERSARSSGPASFRPRSK